MPQRSQSETGHESEGTRAVFLFPFSSCPRARASGHVDSGNSKTKQMFTSHLRSGSTFSPNSASLLRPNWMFSRVTIKPYRQLMVQNVLLYEEEGGGGIRN